MFFVSRDGWVPQCGEGCSNRIPKTLLHEPEERLARFVVYSTLHEALGSALYDVCAGLIRVRGVRQSLEWFVRVGRDRMGSLTSLSLS